MKRLRALRALLRAELQSLARNPRRALLTLLLVALPVAAVIGGSILARVTEKTVEEQRNQFMGSADLRIDGVDRHEDRQRAIGLLSPSAKHETLFVGQEDVLISGLRLRARLVAAAPESLQEGGLASGLVRLLDGQLPKNAGEVAISPAILDAFDGAVGDSVLLEFGDARKITGIAVDPEALDQPLVVRTRAASEHRGATSLLVAIDPSSGEAGLEALRSAGFSAELRSRTGLKSDTATVIFGLGLVGFFEAALIIVAAFSVGLQRRRREIGLLGASGASRPGISVALVLSTSVVAAVGGVFGCALGAAAAGAIHPFLDGWNQRYNGPFEFSVLDAGIAVVIGTATAALATAIPSWRAAGRPIRDALQSRRPSPPPLGRGLAAGLGLAGLGTLLSATTRSGSQLSSALGVVAGPILVIVGLGISSPWILDRLARHSSSLSIAWRIAVRDAGRFRTRNGPVLTAILAGMAMSVTIAALVASLEASIDRIPPPMRDDHILVSGMRAESIAHAIADELDTIAIAPLRFAHARGAPVRVERVEPDGRRRTPALACGDDRLLHALGLGSNAEAFRAGRLLDLQPASERHAERPSAEGLLNERRTHGEESVVRLSTWIRNEPLVGPSSFAVDDAQPTQTPAYLIHESALAEYGMVAGPPITSVVVPWVVRLSHPVTRSALEQAGEIAETRGGATLDAARLHRRPIGTFFYLMLALSVATGLGVVLIANGLAAAESARDALILHTVGAPPSMVRRVTAARSAYLALLGCLLAVPAGLMPAFGLFAVANLSLEFVIPWHSLAWIITLLPITAYAISWLTAGPRLRSPARAAAVIGVSLFGLTSFPVAAESTQDHSSPEIHWQTHDGEAFDGSPLAGEIGRIIVPENRDRPNGPSISLAFVRYRTTHPDPGPPIVYLAGGPGGAGTKLAGKVATHPQIRLLEGRDVIAIDQRGAGLTRPNLVDLEFSESLPLTPAPTRTDYVAAAGRAAARATRHWEKLGIDLSAYNTVESADDIDAVRRALGMPKVALYGASYGTHLGLAYIRRYGDHVSRAVLIRTEGPDDTFKLPSHATAGLERVGFHDREHFGANSSLPQHLDAQIEELRQRPIAVAEGGGSEAIEVGAFDLQLAISHALFDESGIAELPGELRNLFEGQVAVLADAARSNRTISLNAMTLHVDCASGASPGRLERIEAELADPRTTLGDTLLAPFYPETCTAARATELPDRFREPFASDVPTLFVSGTLDIRTPPSNVEMILSGFSNASHIIVENAAHGSRELMSGEYRRLLQAFLRGDSVPSGRITLPPLRPVH